MGVRMPLPPELAEGGVLAARICTICSDWSLVSGVLAGIVLAVRHADTTSDYVEFLVDQSRGGDVGEADESKKGVNIILNLGTGDAAAAPAAGGEFHGAAAAEPAVVAPAAASAITGEISDPRGVD